MSTMNSVNIIGRLTRSVDMRYTTLGIAVSAFGLAINERRKKGEEWVDDTVFVEITTWKKLAENCAQYLGKGDLCGVHGKLKYESWEASDGTKRSKLGVNAINVVFLEKKEHEEPA